MDNNLEWQFNGKRKLLRLTEQSKSSKENKENLKDKYRMPNKILERLNKY